MFSGFCAWGVTDQTTFNRFVWSRSLKVTDFSINCKLIYDFLSRRQLGKYCALSRGFMNLLGIYTVGVARTLCRRLLLDIVIVNCL